ncbi:MAG: ABC transporter ATP-binding protein [Christensenellaceae bacterium]|nr:ABC transporter ATP-binding protein [Christensenellaceae bacterium]
MKKPSNLLKLLDYAGNFRYFTIASWILSALSALLALIPFWYIWRIIKEAIETAPNFSGAGNMVHNGWMAVIFAIIAVLIYISALMCSHVAAFRIASNIRVKAMHHILNLPVGEIELMGSGKMRKIVNESSAATETYLAHQLPDKAGAIATPIGLIFLLFAFDWRLGLLSLAPVFIAFIIMMCMTGAKMQAKMTEYQNALEDMSNQAVEYVRGIPVVKTFGQTVFSFKRFNGAIDNYGKWVIAYTKDLRTPMIFYTAAINGVFVFLIAGALLLSGKAADSGFLLNLIFYIIITPIISITLTKIMFSSENAMIVDDAMKRIDSILNLQPLPEKGRLRPQDASVQLINVSYSYDGAKDAVHGISMDIAGGQTIALVGASGGGKTTVAGLIARFLEAREGKILIGGTDIKSIPKNELMDNIAIVFQNSRLLKASILDNVRLARPNAGREAVIKALEAAQCSDIIEKLPEGIDTVIGSKGIFLSGGEQQRIAIAQAILKDAPIIILDEATAFADPDNESRVQAALSSLAKGRTVIIIAHRLTTVLGADRIFVLDGGEIKEQGTHQELIEQNGLYSQMWKSYQTSIQWKVQKEG